jgi:hypothetical protein
MFVCGILFLIFINSILNPNIMNHLIPTHFALSRNRFVLAMQKENTSETVTLSNDHSMGVCQQQGRTFNPFIVEEVT